MITKVNLSLSAAILVLLGAGTAPAQRTAELRGRVVDQLGAVVVGATVVVTDADGSTKKTTTNSEGRFSFSNLAPGRYSVAISASGFALQEIADVQVTAGRVQQLETILQVAIETQKVTVDTNDRSVAMDTNASRLVLRDKELDALPDDPEELAAALQALAGPTAGPTGPEIYVDGFSATRPPPKQSIREVRINQNTFSAEYDRVGFGRVEVITKPGMDSFRGQTFFTFNDEALNSRNPFAFERAAHQSRAFGGFLSGPLVAKKASFYTDVERREFDDNALVNALTLDGDRNVTRFNEEIPTPQRTISFGPRLDYLVNTNNTLTLRYSFLRASFGNAGVGNFSLPSRAFDTESAEHTLQLTETAIINSVINEFRFQFYHRRYDQKEDSSLPGLNVLDAFFGGGAQIGQANNNQSRWEVQNHTTWRWGQHVMKAGMRLRYVRISDVAPANFGGTYTFAGGLAPELTNDNQIVHDSNGQPVLISISSLERYRRTVLFEDLGLSPEEIRLRGGGAAQFSLAAGDPVARVNQFDIGTYLQADLRWRPNLTLGLGLRYEDQTNIHSPLNFAPRLTVAWAPFSNGKQPFTTVIRAGFGVFYDRFNETLTLEANRFNRANLQRFIVTTATPNEIALLNLFPVVPSVAQLSALAAPQNTVVVAPDLSAPYTLQSVVSVEQQLPRKSTLTLTFNNARGLHLLRSRNINAPLPGFGSSRPDAALGNVFSYESSGVLRQNQLVLTLRSQLNRRTSIFANYVFGKVSSDTDGPQSFPVNQYDLSGEYGRASFDMRHRFFAGGSIGAPWGVTFDPFIVALSSRPFNIVTGRDLNDDAVFTERPSFASDPNAPGVVVTPFGALNPTPLADAVLIPRNFGVGSSFFSVNLRVSKSFGFIDIKKQNQPGPLDKHYNLTLSVLFQNLLNRTNAAPPVGNLSSPFFGVPLALDPGLRFVGGVGGGSLSAAANRRIDVQVRFSF